MRTRLESIYSKRTSLMTEKKMCRVGHHDVELRGMQLRIGLTEVVSDNE